LKTNLQDYIAIYKAVEPSICKQIIDNFDEAKWHKHTYSNPVTKELTSYEDDLDVSFQDKHMEYLSNKINDCVSDYLTNFTPIAFSVQEFSEIRFNRYQIGTNMKFHHDHIHTLFDGEKKGIPILSIIGLLNDNFEGGDLLMLDSKKVQLEAGNIVLFPSNFLYPHAVTTITKGTRYSFVSWGI
jgi:predicted 2-oxoglutarate/Fe(II)-dependent dioxygenase YbiX